MEVAVPLVANATTSTELQPLRQEETELKGMLQSLKLTKQQSCSYPSSPTPHTKQSQELCCHHAKFGDQANKHTDLLQFITMRLAVYICCLLL